MTPVAVVMNLFYTGLGIARSLGERGVPVIGLTRRRVFGNASRYVKAVIAPDSRSEPEALLAFLLNLAKKLDGRAVIFPTRDDDLVFLDRFREELEPHFSLVMPRREVLEACLNKWQTCEWAQKAAVPAPRAWLVEDVASLEQAIAGVSFPCVIKPLSAHYWRRGANWELVGARKAISIGSAAELRAEYRAIARADSRALVQELVTGPDSSLVIAACYMDASSRMVAAFNTRKLLQIPEGFGTGCIVESLARPELIVTTERLLRTMGYTGVAEVEYKYDEAAEEYKLIEINARPWDQHRLGAAAGTDLMYIAYCEHAGIPLPAPRKPRPGAKWIAEDTFATAILRSLKRGEPRLGVLFQRARGKRLYAIWSWKDPLPGLVFWITDFIPGLISGWLRSLAAGRRQARVGLTNQGVSL